ncbi:MAG TPA: hypothetical protein VFW07_20265 [Parafilimonas sp.]|nr:hypothetical protein [Parafilimonas sp.]
MSEPMKIKVDFDNETTKALLNFISDTQEGKYTQEKPDLTQITYRRLQIQEQDKNHSLEDDLSNEMLLFGIL